MYLSKNEEKEIKRILDNKAKNYGFKGSEKETYDRKKSRFTDRLWHIKIEGEEVPVVAFEIEKNIPYNERLRKDIFNLVFSRAPLGYILLPHKRAIEKGNRWYKYTFPKTFKNYYEFFRGFIKIMLCDAEVLLSEKTIRPLDLEKDWPKKVKKYPRKA